LLVGSSLIDLLGSSVLLFLLGLPGWKLFLYRWLFSSRRLSGEEISKELLERAEG
jgi:hypothetical protein